nr:atp synthase subunit e, mitochondrial [Quercus suber]
MASQGVNVLRWSALVFGVFYGFSRQSTITLTDKMAQSQHEYDRQQNLIQDAKRAWAEKNKPSDSSNAITNPEDPNFDLEAVLNKA